VVKLLSVIFAILHFFPKRCATAGVVKLLSVIFAILHFFPKRCATAGGVKRRGDHHAHQEARSAVFSVYSQWSQAATIGEETPEGHNAVSSVLGWWGIFPT
jgi:hypothetical protein